MKTIAAFARRKRGFRSTVTVAMAAMLMLAGAGLATAYVSGPDAASYQHPNGASVDWNAVRDSGQSFAFIKATEGNSGNSGNYVNPYFASDAQAVKAAGMYLGTYHYARPSVNLWGDRYASAVDQAQHYVRTLGDYAKAGNLPPALDYEDTLSGLNPTDLINWAQRWLDTVQQLTGRTPIVYAASWYWSGYLANTTQFAGYPVWVADYTTAAQPAMFGGWNSWTFWQYTDKGRIGGIQADVDLNRFYSDANTLAVLAGGSGDVVAPTATIPTGATTPTDAATPTGAATPAVIPPGVVAPIDADLQVSVAAPQNAVPGQSFQATVTVTNHGPASAAPTTASLVTLGAFTTTNRGGGTAAGAGTDFTTPTLPAGQSKSYPVTMTNDGPLGALIAYAMPNPADPNLFNNFGVAPVLGF